jgi:diadenosine tetraphosphate (Ap4A) HIT family hydrolase/5-methylcytosine-specific restriction endonuclease McrA
MLIELIKGNGKSTGRKIAKSFLDYDETQIEYYQNITKQMPFKFLSKHLKEIKRDKENYTFEGFDLTESQKQELIELCKEQLDKYINKRGIDNILQHRKKSSGYVSGSIRYEVLKRAKTKCEWCGISNEERAIEVDHIIPRSKGGKDELYNFQALCYVCNTQKSNKDDTNVRKIKDSYNDRDKECIFCNISKNKIIKENELAVMIEDNYPVTKNHSLIISKRHCSNYFDLYQPEINACNQLIFETREHLLKKDKSIEGFNIGNNSGEVAGQTINHCHIHLIPRRKGDTENPRGGVRGVIKDKQSY